MFVANLVVDVYRRLGDQNYSEYSTEEDLLSLVDTNVPIHLTPFKPNGTDRSQTTTHIASHRRNHSLRKDDELRAANGRRFVIDLVDGTNGVFVSNAVVLWLTEHDAVV